MLALMTWLWFDGWMTRPVGVEVSVADREILERRVAAATTERRDWQRAKIVLMAARGVSSPKVAEVVGVNRNQVDLWKRRFRNEGLDGLRDRDRSGRPQVYGPEDRLTLVKTITTRPPESGQLSAKRRKARMSMPEVARILNDDHDIAISESQVWRICKTMKIKPWQVRSWMTSHDPDFDDKAVDICGLYLDPGENWAVFSVDEKTGMQAKSRINPTQPAVEGSARPAGVRVQTPRHTSAVCCVRVRHRRSDCQAVGLDTRRELHWVLGRTRLPSRGPSRVALHCRLMPTS